MNKWRVWGIVLVVVPALAGLWWILGRQGQRNQSEIKTVRPYYGSIRIEVSTTGTIQPQNRLELKPPIAGRVEQILVREGDAVRRGQTLVWMSSTERAALLDAARAQGAEALADWSDTYKAAPVISPIDGTVIVRAVEPGQTVSTAEAILVLSDRLIVKAQVDETDIGKLKVGQEAAVTLDAYPEIQVPAMIDHIAYESVVVNNVTIYEVDILPTKVPAVFRSGMSANAAITTAFKEQALLIDKTAVLQRDQKYFVSLHTGPDTRPAPRRVEVGLVGEKVMEILAGLTPEDTVLVEVPDFSKLKSNLNEKTNPFMPRRPGQRRPSR